MLGSMAESQDVRLILSLSAHITGTQTAIKWDQHSSKKLHVLWGRIANESTKKKKLAVLLSIESMIYNI